MKKTYLLMFIAIAGIFSGCSDYRTERYMINEPVFMSMAELRSKDIKTTTAQQIKEQGKICFYNGYLYISEPGKGFHIIDNRDPHQPKAVGFVELNGNADISIRNDRLYADSYVDLLWFNISNPAVPVYTNRLEGVFEQTLPPIDNEYGIDYAMCYSRSDQKESVVAGWKVGKREYTYRKDVYYEVDAAAPMSNGGGQGINGSMSRFSLYKDYLYAVINNEMSIFDLSKDVPVKCVENIHIGGEVETIFSYGENMFMGMPRGMMIYSVKDPLNPEYMSAISHVFGCDPVVVEDDIAYVTVHSGNFCGQNANELIVIDVKDVKNPTHIVTYNMKNPKGLGIDNGTLFICDDGLKVFNASEPQKIMANQLAHYKGMDGYDVIPFNSVLMMIADDGLYQYDYSDLDKIKQISKIKIGK
jgi:Uncharacterized conserved protein